MIITIDKNTLQVVGVEGGVDSAMKKELLHTSADLTQSPLVFEDWLVNQKVNTRIFWKNCKSKYNGWGCERVVLVKEDSPYDWLSTAFSWSGTLLSLSYYDLEALNSKWKASVEETESKDIKIEFGFGTKQQ